MILVHPWALLLLVLVPLAWFLPRRPRDLGEGLLRSLLLGLLILALARPLVPTRDEGGRLVWIADRSASVEAPAPSPAAQAEALPFTLAPHVRLARIDLEGEATPLGAALQRAAASIPPEGRGAVLLDSDGLSTDRDWARATQALAQRGIPVHILPRRARPGPPRPAAIEPRGELRVGRPARVVVRVRDGEADCRVRLIGPEGVLAEAPLEEEGRALLEFEPDRPGWLAVTAEVEGRDGAIERLEVSLAVQDPLRVLYLGGGTAGGADELGKLLGAGFEIEEGEVRPQDLANYDLVLIDDRPAASVDSAAQEALRRAVLDGGLGLVMAGAGAFGPGGWHETPVMDLMPVEALQKEEKRDPSTTLVVIIDTSGSMGGNRVQLAKEVARLAIARLLPHDKVGIVEFYGAKRWAAPIQPASNRIELERALNRLNAGGGTVILPAIEEAYYGLKNVQTRYKHVLVLTDGGVERGNFEGMIRRMADDGITVSTVLIGGDAHSEFLVSIANWGKGRFYSVPNRFNLPEILLKQPTTAKLPAWRSGEQVLRARGGSSWWGEVDPNAIPPLAGFVETRARPGAEVLLETERGGYPILATWRPGLGRTTALTTGPVGRGSEPWSDWDGYGAALGRILARTASDLRMPYRWSVERRGFEAWIQAERLVADPPAPRAEFADGTPLPLEESAPGIFTARVVCGADEELRLVGHAGGAQQRLVLPAAPTEDRVLPEKTLDLEALAAATGGQTLTPGAVPPLGGGQGERGLRDWRVACLLAALLTLFADILWRRRP